MFFVLSTWTPYLVVVLGTILLADGVLNDWPGSAMIVCTAVVLVGLVWPLLREVL
jgi:hypothetical protein